MEQPVAPVKRVATELTLEDLQSEFARYGISSGDSNARFNALQERYDEEYDASILEYDAAVQKLEMQRTKQTYHDALERAIRLEQEALQREPTAATIVRQLETNVAPQRLVVRGISPLSCCALFRAMRNNSNVVSLDVSNNDLTDVIAVPVGNMLTTNKKLRALDLGFNKLTMASLQPIGNALRVNAVLTSLLMNSNPIFQLPKDATSSNGAAPSNSKVSPYLALVEPFTSALAVNSSLTSLSLFNTGISHDVGRVLAHALSKSLSLISVDVGNNLLGQTDLVSIASLLKKNQTRFFQAEAKSEQLHDDMKEQALVVQAEKEKEAKRIADMEWHEDNARKRAEIREAEEWERARLQAEAEVQHLLDIEAENKKYLERREAEKKPAKAKGKK